MKTLIRVFALCSLFLASLAWGQTLQYRAGLAINAGQCVAITQISGGPYAVPCDNTGDVYPLGIGGLIPPAIGVALNSTGPVSCRTGVSEPCPPVNPPLVTVQYAGIVTVPNTAGQVGIPGGAFVGDIDGTGNLNDLGFAFCTCNGEQTYVGLNLGQNGNYTTIQILLLPGYIPTDGSNAGASTKRVKRIK